MTANSDGSSSTVSHCDLDVGVDEQEHRKKEKLVPVGHFKRYFM